MSIEIRESDETAVMWVADHLCAADDLEITTVSGLPPRESVQFGVTVATDSFAVHPILNGVAGAPVALFGVVDDGERSPGWGVIWLVGTDMLLKTSMDIFKAAPCWLDAWLDRFPAGLHNLVDMRNERHIKWIKRMGGKFDGTGKILNGQKFAYFSIQRPPITETQGEMS
jgi:hypothetical protein